MPFDSSRPRPLNLTVINPNFLSADYQYFADRPNSVGGRRKTPPSSNPCLPLDSPQQPIPFPRIPSNLTKPVDPPLQPIPRTPSNLTKPVDSPQQPIPQTPSGITKPVDSPQQPIPQTPSGITKPVDSPLKRIPRTPSNLTKPVDSPQKPIPRTPSNLTKPVDSPQKPIPRTPSNLTKPVDSPQKPIPRTPSGITKPVDSPQQPISRTISKSVSQPIRPTPRFHRMMSLPVIKVNPNFLSADYQYSGDRPKSVCGRPKTPTFPNPCLTPNRDDRRVPAVSASHSSSHNYQKTVLNNSAFNSWKSMNSCLEIDPVFGGTYGNQQTSEPCLDPISRRLSWEISKLDTSDYYSDISRDCDSYSNILTPVPRECVTWRDKQSEAEPKVFVFGLVENKYVFCTFCSRRI